MIFILENNLTTVLHFLEELANPKITNVRRFNEN